jgi:hypothetical protein
MFSPAFRLILVATCLLLAIRIAPAGPVSWALYIAASLLFAGLFRSGSVWLAWRAFGYGDYEEMERCLGWTRAPAFLSATQRAYFEFLQGVSARDRGELPLASTHFAIAAAGELRSASDRCLVLVNLAEVQAALGDTAAMGETVTQLRSLSPAAAVEGRIAQIELVHCRSRIASSDQL